MALQTDAFEIDMERAGIPGTSLEVSRVGPEFMAPLARRALAAV
jgi:hypothetical protein